MSQSSADSQLINAIIQNLKSRGIFDEFRRECLSDADTKPSFQNLLQRVEGYVSKFLSQQKWNQNINKNQLRESLRTQINGSEMLKYGTEHLVEQVVNYKINSMFWPKIESVVKEFLGIQEIPAIPVTPSAQINDNLSKYNSKKSSKTDKNIEIKIIDIKVEPKEENVFESASQQMDIETDSSSSIGYQSKRIKEENESNACIGDSDNGYIDWPTPPEPEMLTPERPQLIYSPIGAKESQKSSEDSNSVPNIKTEEICLNNEIKENETFLINKRLMDEMKDKKKIKPIADKCATDPNVDKEVGLSDVSSVHTSDLSDFDDEISLDDSNDECEVNKKQKISLKVVKKITEVLSNEQIGDRNINRESIVQKESPIDEPNSEITKSESKRIRRVNPKYSSEEFSSMFTEKERSVQSTSREEFEESNNEQKPSKAELDQKLSSRRRRRYSNSSDNEMKDMNELIANPSLKLIKKEDILLESRSSSRGSIESSLSETTQDSTQSQRSLKRKISKNRNESQTQRYEASDLYKPRPVISSRRTRGPTTPDSSTQSNEDFFIHDLSK